MSQGDAEDALPRIEAAVRSMLARIRRPAETFRFARTPQDDGSPHVELADGGYAWVRTERGIELERRMVDADALLFLVMELLTRDYAQQAELQSRGNQGYSRWRWIEAHIRLMAHLDLTWGARLSERYEKTLSATPLSPAEMQASLDPLDLTSFGID